MINKSLSLSAGYKIDLQELEDFVAEAKTLGCQSVTWHADIPNSRDPRESDTLTLTASPDRG